jgi:hypothetical protein
LFTHKDLRTIANPRKTTRNDTIISKSRSRWASAKCCFFYFVATGIAVFDSELFIGGRYRTTVDKLLQSVILLFSKLLHFYIPAHFQRRHTKATEKLLLSLQPELIRTRTNIKCHIFSRFCSIGNSESPLDEFAVFPDGLLAFGNLNISQADLGNAHLGFTVDGNAHLKDERIIGSSPVRRYHAPNRLDRT